jgi:Rod binding domain-containing protein
LRSVDKPPISESLPVLAPAHAAAKPATHDAELLATARAFESVFIAQMLAHTGFGKALSTESGFGGEAFSSLLVEEYANRLIEKGGFGLAEKVYEQLRAREAANAERTLA